MRVTAQTLENILVALGLLLLCALVVYSGVDTIAAEVARVGWGFALVLLAEIPVIAASALGWRLALVPAQRGVPVRRLVEFRVVGEAINHLTPTAALGGEFIRARLAGPYIGAVDGAASVTLAKFTETAGQYLFTLAGMLFLLPQVQTLAPYRSGVAVVAVAVVAGVAGFAALLRYGAFSAGARWVSRFTPWRSAVQIHREGIDAVDASIRVAFEERRFDLAWSTLSFAVAYAFRLAEIWIVLTFLGLPATAVNCMGIEVLTVLVNTLFFFVPGKIGTREGGKMLIFVLLGLPPEKGLALGLVRRARELCWDVSGLMLYAAERRRQAK